MTDKVQKIREEVERIINRRLNLINGDYFDLNEETNGLTNEIIDAIELLQEEPVPQFKVGDTIRSKVWESAVHEIVFMDNSAYFFENGGMVRFTDQEQWELVKEPISKELEEAAKERVDAEDYCFVDKDGMPLYDSDYLEYMFKEGAQWQKENLWKPADGDDLPEYDREVVAFQEAFPTDVDVPSLFKIVIAHRPNPEGYDGKSIATGEVKHYTPKTYDKGGWNIPNIKYWLDVELPKEIEL